MLTLNNVSLEKAMNFRKETISQIFGILNRELFVSPPYQIETNLFGKFLKNVKKIIDLSHTANFDWKNVSEKSTSHFDLLSPQFSNRDNDFFFLKNYKFWSKLNTFYFFTYFRNDCEINCLKKCTNYCQEDLKQFSYK